jgi:hypothetical protein
MIDLCDAAAIALEYGCETWGDVRWLLVPLLSTGAVPGTCVENGRPRAITPEEWQAGYDFDFRTNTLIGDGARYSLQGVCVDGAVIRARLGGPRAWRANHPDLCLAFDAKCRGCGGPPDRPKGWRIQADLEAWIADYEGVSEATARRYAVELLTKGSHLI